MKKIKDDSWRRPRLASSSNYIKRLCVSVCVSVRMSRSLLSCIKSVWKAGGIVRTVLVRACYIPSFKKFHARVHAISRNFTQFSRNLGYFSHFWANFNMLGIKMHVLELRNSMVILSRTFTHSLTQLHAISHNFCFFSHFWANFNMLGIKMHVLELRNSLVILSKNFTRVFTQFHAISHNFHAIWAISAIFGPISTCWVSKSIHSSLQIHW